MQKIIIDTNVLVSAIIQRNFPFLILNEVFTRSDLTHCISDDLFKEYFEVLNRKKFSRFPDFVSSAQFILTEIRRISKMYYPKSRIELIHDKNDNKLLELSKESKAHFLITGNLNDFTMKIFEKTKIVTPREYWIEHIPK